MSGRETERRGEKERHESEMTETNVENRETDVA